VAQEHLGGGDPEEGEDGGKGFGDPCVRGGKVYYLAVLVRGDQGTGQGYRYCKKEIRKKRDTSRCFDEKVTS